MTREELLEEIKAEFADTARWTGRPMPSARVMAALAKVPRDQFVPETEVALAYANSALPIGYRQTISQPFIVALMTDLLDLQPSASVLEIGTGSGYQAAVLAELAAGVFTIEVVPELAERARKTLARLGYANVAVRAGDGGRGWPECAPFEAIIVTAATPDVPAPLANQLRPGGRMVIPLGPAGGDQVLTVVTKTRTGAIRRVPTLDVAFVPFVTPPPAGRAIARPSGPPQVILT